MGQRYYSSVAGLMALTAAVASSDLSVTVDTVAGLPVSVPFTLIVDAGKTSEEVVTVTAVAGTRLTVVRGEDGTAAQAHTTGAVVRHGFTARDLREPQQHMAASAGVHGLPAGDVVAGLTAAQTFANKTISGAINTLTAIPQSAVAGLAGSGIPDAANLDDYVTQGLYTQNVDDQAATGTNYPSPAAGMLEVSAGVSSMVYQRYTVYNYNSGLGNRVYTRSKYSGAWSAWREIGGVAPGAITMFGGAATPAGWLLCQGQAVSRATYADLYAAIGTAYGAGGGTTTFNLPNLKGRIPAGLDTAQTEFNALAKTGGEKTHALTLAENGPHGHTLTDPGHNHTQNAHNHSQNAHDHGLQETSDMVTIATTQRSVVLGGGNIFSTNDPYDVVSATATNNPATATNNANTTGITLANSGSGSPHNNLQPYITLNFIIKA